MSRPEIVRPLIIVGAPRSGTTLLFAILSSHPDLWSLYRETEIVIEDLVDPASSGWTTGNRLTAEDASEELASEIRRRLSHQAMNYQAMWPNLRSPIFSHRIRERLARAVFRLGLPRWRRPAEIRLVEKNPKNCLRIPFLDRIFPDALFLFLSRDPRSNIGSLLEGWNTLGRFRTYRVPGGVEIQGYRESEWWKFLLPPDWERHVRGERLEEVCAYQYGTANETAWTDLETLPPERRLRLSYEDLVDRPVESMRRVCTWSGLSYGGGLKRMAETLPPVNVTSAPSAEKWRRHEAEVLAVLDSVAGVASRMGYEA